MAKHQGSNLKIIKIKPYSKIEKTKPKKAKILGIRSLKFYRLPDNALDKVPLIKINKIIETEIKKFRPDDFTHSNHDLNVDHIIAHNSTITVCRPFKFKFINSIFAFEISSSTESNFKISKKKFFPNVFVDIKKEIKKKLKELEIYKNEIEKWPHPRSIKGVKILSNYRGFQSGLECAESFQIIRGNKTII